MNCSALVYKQNLVKESCSTVVKVHLENICFGLCTFKNKACDCCSKMENQT